MPMCPDDADGSLDPMWPQTNASGRQDATHTAIPPTLRHPSTPTSACHAKGRTHQVIPASQRTVAQATPTHTVACYHRAHAPVRLNS
mmetsp:Transcript_102712/g.174067  ORF Transcript_102712/g.174067 Transcript_102712/m.174067 type:complete len:87 (+) Transcript_102712:166-426(+)